MNSIVLSEIIRDSLSTAIGLNSYFSPIAEKVFKLTQRVELESNGEFQKCCVRKTLLKGDFLLKQGEISSKVWYMQSGIAHEYMQKGKQILTQSFFFPNVFVDYFPSSIGGIPSPRNIRLLTDAEVIEIDTSRMMAIENVRDLIYETRSYIIVFFSLDLRERMTQFQFLSAQERYALLMERQPYLIKEIPSIYLADYLGISPETLSRIRSKNTFNKTFENKSVSEYVFEKMENKRKIVGDGK